MELQMQLQEAMRAARSAHASRSWGCARVYAVFGRLQPGQKKIIQQVTKKTIVTTTLGRNCLYWGYDNSTGIDYASAKAFCETLDKYGTVSVTVDAIED